MNDPERLRTQRAGEITGLLLESVRDDAPRPGAEARALAAFGAAGAFGVSVATAGAAAVGPKTAAGALLLTIAKWMGVGAATALATVGAVEGVRRLATPLPVVAPPPSSAAVSPTRRFPFSASQTGLPRPRAGDEQQPTGVSPAQDVAHSPASSALGGHSPNSSTRPAAEPMATMVMGSPSRLAQEVAALDSARTALKAGDAGQALTLLEAHARDFPLGRLGPEATLLRIEALLGSGDRVRAEQLARGFLATNPSSSHAAKVRRLLATLSLRDAAPFGAATSR